MCSHYARTLYFILRRVGGGRNWHTYCNVYIRYLYTIHQFYCLHVYTLCIDPKNLHWRFAYITLFVTHSSHKETFLVISPFPINERSPLLPLLLAPP